MDVRAPGARPRFWVLAVFLCLVFFLGGSSQESVPTLMVLRPVAILVAAYALLTLHAPDLRSYRHLALFAGAVLLLTIVHLVPLPPSIWQALPGREVIRDIDALIGNGDPWRPLSMAPASTWNALYSLAVPLATLALAIQLTRGEHLYLAVLLVLLITISGLIALLQATGSGILLYARSSEVSGLFSNRNHQGLLLALLLPLLAVVSTVGSREGIAPPWTKIVALGLAVVTVPLILVAGSRAALGVMLVAVLALPMLRLRDRSGILSHRRIWLMGGILAIVLIGGIILFLALSARHSGIDRLGATAEDLRYPVWGSIWQVLPRYLPWGTGIGTYATVYQITEPAALLRPTFSNHAHNDYLEILFTAGIPGAFLAVWACALFLAAVWKSLSVRGSYASFCRLGVVIVVIVALASVVDYPVRTPLLASVLAIAAVWAASFRKFGSEIDGE